MVFLGDTSVHPPLGKFHFGGLPCKLMEQRGSLSFQSVQFHVPARVPTGPARVCAHLESVAEWPWTHVPTPSQGGESTSPSTLWGQRAGQGGLLQAGRAEKAAGEGHLTVSLAGVPAAPPPELEKGAKWPGAAGHGALQSSSAAAALTLTPALARRGELTGSAWSRAVSFNNPGGDLQLCPGCV